MPDYSFIEDKKEFSNNHAQPELFEMEPEWKEHWTGMPEYRSENQAGNFSVVIHFQNLDGLKMFSQLIGQTVTPLTKGIYFPLRNKNNFEYVEEEK